MLGLSVPKKSDQIADQPFPPARVLQSGAAQEECPFATPAIPVIVCTHQLVRALATMDRIPLLPLCLRIQH